MPQIINIINDNNNNNNKKWKLSKANLVVAARLWRPYLSDTAVCTWVRLIKLSDSDSRSVKAANDYRRRTSLETLPFICLQHVRGGASGARRLNCYRKQDRQLRCVARWALSVADYVIFYCRKHLYIYISICSYICMYVVALLDSSRGDLQSLSRMFIARQRHFAESQRLLIRVLESHACLYMYVCTTASGMQFWRSRRLAVPRRAVWWQRFVYCFKNICFNFIACPLQLVVAA